MKYKPKKIFVIENGEYIEITYQEFAARCEANDSYPKQRFIYIDGIILEMPQEKRKEFYKDKRRQKYQRECERKFSVFSYDSLTTMAKILLSIHLLMYLMQLSTKLCWKNLMNV